MLKGVRSVLVGAASVQPVTKYVATYVHTVFYSNIFVIPSRLAGSLMLRAKCTPGDAAHVSASDACRVHYRLTRNECTLDRLVTSAL